VKTENQPTVIISVLTRPMRSASTPAAIPPIAETPSVTVTSVPVAPVPTPNVAPIADSDSVRMIRSKASSPKPMNDVLKARRSLPLSARSHEGPKPPSPIRAVPASIAPPPSAANRVV